MSASKWNWNFGKLVFVLLCGGSKTVETGGKPSEQLDVSQQQNQPILTSGL